MCVICKRARTGGESDPDRGGRPCFRHRVCVSSFSRNFAATLFAPIPVLQELNGEQLRTFYKVNGALTFSF